MEQQDSSTLDAVAVEMLKHKIREQVIQDGGAAKGDALSKLNGIASEFGQVKQEILNRMNELEKMMDDVFPDLIEEVQGISKRLDNLNAEFFTNIFRDVLRKELKAQGESQSKEVIAHLNVGIEGLTNTLLES